MSCTVVAKPLYVLNKAETRFAVYEYNLLFVRDRMCYLVDQEVERASTNRKVDGSIPGHRGVL